MNKIELTPRQEAEKAEAWSRWLEKPQTEPLHAFGYAWGCAVAYREAELDELRAEVERLREINDAQARLINTQQERIAALTANPFERREVIIEGEDPDRDPDTPPEES